MILIMYPILLGKTISYQIKEVILLEINEVIAKCMEAPGISVLKDDDKTTLCLEQKDGNGTMRFFSIFPGVTLAYIDIHSPTWPAPDLSGLAIDGEGMMTVNYCLHGRCELVLNNSSYVYLTESQISLTERFAESQYIYPRRAYEGLELFIDLSSAAKEEVCLNRDFNLQMEQLKRRYCPSGETYIADASFRVEWNFQLLWELGQNREIAPARMKIAVLALLDLLLHEKMSTSRPCTFYTESQVNIAKKTESILTSDLSRRYPVRELAAGFGVSETSLKNYFRGVYGKNISDYLRDLRMERAASLLASTRDTVVQIAEVVGYTNQSKFASVFKKKYGVTPLEYRRTVRLSDHGK